MTRPSVLERTFRDQRRSLLVWAVALISLVGIYVAIYPSIKGNSSYTKLIDQMPKAYRAFLSLSSGSDLTSATGYLDTELFSFMGPLLVLVFSIGAGSSAVAGEEDRHTLDLLLANPVSRARVVAEKFLAIVAGLAFLMVILWSAVMVEGTLAGMHISAAHSAAAVTHLGLLGVEFAAVALLAGCVTGRVGVSRAVAGMLAAGAYLVNGLAGLAGWLRPVRPLSPYYQFIGHDPLRTGMWPAAAVAMAVTAAVVAATGAWTFEHRDVRQ